MTYKALSVDLLNFPFQVQLHLKSFIDHWRSVLSSGATTVSEEAVRSIEQTLHEHPFLLEPIGDLGLLKDHQEFLKLLFAPMLPHQSLSNAIQAVSVPFLHHLAIASTETYHKLTEAKDGKFEILYVSASKEHIDFRILYAYKLILKTFYNFDIKVDQPVNSSFVNEKTGLCRYFKLTGGSQFIEAINLAPLPHFDEQMLQELLDQHFDATIWTKLLPPENFLFSGVSLISMVDITIEESSTRLQYALLNHEHTEDAKWFSSLQQEMRNLFRLSGLRLGIATVQRNGELNFNSRNPLWNSLLLREFAPDASWIQGSVYEEIMSTGKMILIEDIRKQPSGMSPLVQVVVDAGFTNLLLTPLMYEQRMIGILELASPIPGEINGLSLFKITQMKTIFANALKRHLDEFENRVEAIMLEQFTSIHPAIQWRFRDAAIGLLDKSRNGAADQDIIFENVYPFYGSLDVRDSSKKRARAIERDLLYNLEHAHDVLHQCHEILAFDILGELMNQVEEKLKRVQCSFSSGDELSLAEFIRKEINPVLINVHQHHPQVRKVTQSYIDIASSESGICTKNRSAYEEALSLVNSCMINCLDEEEKDLQRLYPCYFEKFRTDGVEYNIYTGPSIAPGRPFDPMYLDNLRLRQLLWTSKIIGMTNALRPRMQELFERAHVSTPCETSTEMAHETCIEIAPLILAYGNPITLKFRPDEKRLDIEGTSNVRYEMMKKRLDKALILGSQQRLTQPGYIAIVYSTEDEASAYFRHLAYLSKKGFVQTQFEHLDIEALQGVEGLRAIRVSV